MNYFNNINDFPNINFLEVALFLQAQRPKSAVAIRHPLDFFVGLIID